MSGSARIVIGESAAPEFPFGRPYTDRASKAEHIAARFGAILKGSVLDVGCDQAPLRRLVAPGTRYVGVDLDPAAADFIIDLDRQRLPFAPGSFDTVVCTDVLEHLERCHEVLDQLCAIARRHVLVSLPSPLHATLDGVRARNNGWKKFYGLPCEPPEDRHRWFFGFDDARTFLETRARRCGFGIRQLDVESASGRPWRDESGADVLDQPNTRYGILWCVLQRDEVA